MDQFEECIVVIPKGHKKQKVLLYFCTLCKRSFNNVEVHVAGHKHGRLTSVQDILPHLQKHGIDWINKSKKALFCYFCSLELGLEPANLEQHVRKHAHVIEEPRETDPEIYRVNRVQPKVHSVIQSRQTKKFSSQYMLEVLATEYVSICSPASLVDPTGELVYLTNNVFTVDELEAISEKARWLESHGRTIHRGVHKGGSRMVTFGLRYKYGTLAWYKHSNIYYGPSEELVTMVSMGLKRHFEPIFQHLYQIRKGEGIGTSEGCMGQSPFTSISITHDYHCKVHSDKNDFSYSFFIWLGDGVEVNGKGSRFFFPEFKKYFVPQKGDVMLTKASGIQHATRTKGPRGQFALCVYMQASFFPMWRVVQTDLQVIEAGGELSEPKLKLLNHWLENNRVYEQHKNF